MLQAIERGPEIDEAGIAGWRELIAGQRARVEAEQLFEPAPILLVGQVVTHLPLVDGCRTHSELVSDS